MQLANAVSVRERVRHIDTTIAEIHDSDNPSTNAGSRSSRFSQAIVYDRDRANSETQSAGAVSSMSVIEREWLHATLAVDYHRMCALLRKQPSLACFRDYVTGATALHRTVMNPDCVKLLVGNYKATVDARTYSGATALHIFAQKLMNANRSEIDEEAVVSVCELLVRGYSANISIRDYSGRQAVHYLPTDAPRRVRDLLSPMRLDAQLGQSVYAALFGLATTSNTESKQPQSSTVTLNARLRSAFVFKQRSSHSDAQSIATLTPPKAPRSWLPPSFTNAVRGVTRNTIFTSVSDETESDDAAAPSQFTRGHLRRSISADTRAQSGAQTVYESGV